MGSWSVAGHSWLVGSERPYTNSWIVICNKQLDCYLHMNSWIVICIKTAGLLSAYKQLDCYLHISSWIVICI
jgi:hypothetical protein